MPGPPAPQGLDGKEEEVDTTEAFCEHQSEIASASIPVVPSNSRTVTFPPTHRLTKRQIKALFSLLRAHRQPTTAADATMRGPTTATTLERDGETPDSHGQALVPLLDRHSENHLRQLVLGLRSSENTGSARFPAAKATETPILPHLVIWVDASNLRVRIARQKFSESWLGQQCLFLRDMCHQFAIPHLCLDASFCGKVRGLFEETSQFNAARYKAKLAVTAATPTADDPLSEVLLPLPSEHLNVIGVILRTVETSHAVALRRLVGEIPQLPCTVEPQASLTIQRPPTTLAVAASAAALAALEELDDGAATDRPPSSASKSTQEIRSEPGSLDAVALFNESCRPQTHPVAAPQDPKKRQQPEEFGQPLLDAPPPKSGKKCRTMGKGRKICQEAEPQAHPVDTAANYAAASHTIDASVPSAASLICADSAYPFTAAAATTTCFESICLTAVRATFNAGAENGQSVVSDDVALASSKSEGADDVDALVTRVRLEEHVSVLEATVQGLAQRKQSLERELEAANGTRQRLVQLAEPLETQVDKLQSTCQRQSALMETLTRSLAKSRQALARLLTANLTVEEIVELAHEQDGMERAVEAGVHSAEVGSPTATSQADASSIFAPTGSVPVPLASEWSLYDEESVRTLPLAAQLLQVDEEVEGKLVRIASFLTQSSLKQFWKKRDIDGAIMGFLPCLSSKNALRKILDLCCREMLALDAQLFPNPIHRRLALKHTCLDDRLLLEKSTSSMDEAKDLQPLTITAEPSENHPKIIPDVTLCPFELSGVCADQLCPYQHLKDRPNGNILPREFLPLAPIKDLRRAKSRHPEKLERQPLGQDNPEPARPDCGIEDYLALPFTVDDDSSDEADGADDSREVINDFKDRDRDKWDWWNSHTDRLHFASDVDHLSFDDVIRSIGWVLTSDELSLESPHDLVQGCLFFGKVVESFRLSIHAGRFDMANAVMSFSGRTLQSWGNSSSQIVPIFSQVCDKILAILQVVHSCAFAFDGATRKSLFRAAADSQKMLGLTSLFLRQFHKLLNANTASLTVGTVANHLDLAADLYNMAVQQLRDANVGAMKSRDEVAQASTMNPTVVANHSTCNSTSETSYDKSIAQWLDDSREEFPLHFEASLESLSPSDALLAAWDRFKESLEAGNASADNDFATFAGVCQVTDACLRALDIAIFRKEEAVSNPPVANDKAELSLVLLAVNKILTGIRKLKILTPTHECIITPAIAAYVTALCGMQMYDKAQQELKRTLFSSCDCTSFLMLSELLWSQQVQLLLTLPPFSASEVPRRDPDFQLPHVVSEGNDLIASRLGALGVYPHHVVLPGDWNLVLMVMSSIEGSQNMISQSFRSCRNLILSLDLPLLLNLSIADRPLRFRHFRSDTTLLASPLPSCILAAGSSLVNLDLTSCGLGVLSLHFGHYFPLLEVLKLSRNQLKWLPSSLLLLDRLRLLNLDDNDLQRLPPPFLFANLTVLSVQRNALQSLPQGIEDCCSLQVLRLKDNIMLHFDASVLAARLPKLRELEFDETSSR